VNLDVRFPDGGPFVKLVPFPGGNLMARLLRVGAELVFLSLALFPVMSYGQTKASAPTIIIYKTPT
jgi:hypothetical protein